MWQLLVVVAGALYVKPQLKSRNVEIINDVSKPKLSMKTLCKESALLFKIFYLAAAATTTTLQKKEVCA